MDHQIPRRCRLDQMVPAELAIRDAVGAVEMVGADPVLTEAVMLLSQAQDKVADYVDRTGFQGRPLVEMGFPLHRDDEICLSIRAPKGHLVGVGEVKLTGLRYGAFSAIDGVDVDDLEDLLLAIGAAAARVIEQKIETVRRVFDANMRANRERSGQA